MQKRKRPTRAVQLRAPLGDESTGLVEAAGTCILFVDVHRDFAVELLSVADQPAAPAPTEVLRGEEQRFDLVAQHAHEPDRLPPVGAEHPEAELGQRQVPYEREEGLDVALGQEVVGRPNGA
jgi:hypothetical protein